MESRKRINDVDVYNIINKVKADDENSFKEALIALLEVVVDTRSFLRKIYKDLPRRSKNIVNDPSKQKDGDVVVGI